MKYIKYILFLLFFSFLVMEVGLRIKGDYYTYSEKIQGVYHSYYGQEKDTWYHTWWPNDTFDLDHGEFSYPYYINEMGIRERMPDKNDDSKYKLFFFGDSFTEGVGAPYDSSFVRQVETRFIEDSIDISVYNFGVSGSDPLYNYVLLRDSLLQFNPTHVIFCPNRTDIQDVLVRGGLERFQPDGSTSSRKAPWFHIFYRFLHSVRFLMHTVYNYDEMLLKPSEKDALTNASLNQILKTNNLTHELCSTNNIDFKVIVHMMPGEACSGDFDNEALLALTPDSTEYELIKIAEQFNIYSQKEGCGKLGWPIDGHFTSFGYQVLGNFIYEEIKNDFTNQIDSNAVD